MKITGIISLQYKRMKRKNTHFFHTNSFPFTPTKLSDNFCCNQEIYKEFIRQCFQIQNYFTIITFGIQVFEGKSCLYVSKEGEIQRKEHDVQLIWWCEQCNRSTSSIPNSNKAELRIITSLIYINITGNKNRNRRRSFTGSVEPYSIFRKGPRCYFTKNHKEQKLPVIKWQKLFPELSKKKSHFTSSRIIRGIYTLLSVPLS